MSINVTQCYQPLIFIHGLIHQRPTMVRSIRLVLVVGLSSKTWWHWVKLSWATEISTQQKTRWETQSLSSTVLGHDWVNSLKPCLILPRLVQIQNFLETISNFFFFFVNIQIESWVIDSVMTQLFLAQPYFQIIYAILRRIRKLEVPGWKGMRLSRFGFGHWNLGRVKINISFHIFLLNILTCLDWALV